MITEQEKSWCLCQWDFVLPNGSEQFRHIPRSPRIIFLFLCPVLLHSCHLYLCWSHSHKFYYNRNSFTTWILGICFDLDIIWEFSRTGSSFVFRRRRESTTCLVNGKLGRLSSQNKNSFSIKCYHRRLTKSVIDVSVYTRLQCWTLSAGSPLPA